MFQFSQRADIQSEKTLRQVSMTPGGTQVGTPAPSEAPSSTSGGTEPQGPQKPQRHPASALLAAAVGRCPAVGDIGASVQPRSVGNRRLCGLCQGKVQEVYRDVHGG